MLDLLRQRNFSLLWFAGLISVAGDFALVVASPLFIYERTDSTLATAGIFAARYVPNILFGSVAGVFVDRWDRKRTMIGADLLRAAAVFLLLIASQTGALWPVYLVAALLGTIGLFFSPAENALLPQLVESDRLVTANALNALNDNLGRLVGPALGALLYAERGLGGAALVDSATFLASALLIRLIVAPTRERIVLAETGRHAMHRALDEWRGGLVLVRRSRALSVIFAASAMGMIAEGFFVTLALAPFVLDVLGGTEAQVGWIGSAQAIGGLIAGAVIARHGPRISKRRLLGIGMIGIGLADMIQFNARRIAGPGTPAVSLAMGCMFLAGFPAVALGTSSLTLLQDLTVDDYRGRVFGALTAIQGIAVLVGLAAAGVLGDAVGIVPSLTAGAAMWLVGGALALAFLPPSELTEPAVGAPS